MCVWYILLKYLKICVYSCYHIFGYRNNSNKNSNIFYGFSLAISWTPEISLKYILNSFPAWSSYPLTFSPDIRKLFLSSWFRQCSQSSHSTYQGPSLRVHQSYKSYNCPLSMRTYLYLGGESVVVCKGRGYNFTFWCHVVADCLIVT